MIRFFALFIVFTSILADLTWVSITSPITQKRLKKLMEVAGRLEWVDTIVDDLCTQYPELRPSSEEGVQTLKLELNYFVMASKHDQDAVIRGNSSKFPVVTAKIEQLRKIAKREIKKLEGIYKGLYEDVDQFITSHLYSSMARLHLRRNTNQLDRGITEQLVRREIEEKEAELWESWRGFRPESELQDIMVISEHLKYEL